MKKEITFTLLFTCGLIVHYSKFILPLSFVSVSSVLSILIMSGALYWHNNHKTELRPKSVYTFASIITAYIIASSFYELVRPFLHF